MRLAPTRSRTCGRRSMVPPWRLTQLLLVLLAGAGCSADAPTEFDREDEGSLGIVTETEPKLADADLFIGTFSGLGGAIPDFGADVTESVEGAMSMRATVSSQGDGFAGWFVSWGNASQVADDGFTRDMSAYVGGSLGFWVRSLVGLEVGIRSGDVFAGSETSKAVLGNSVGFLPDDSWRDVCLPLASFTSGQRPADLTRIKVFFVVAVNRASGGTRGALETFWIDDVRWEQSSCT